MAITRAQQAKQMLREGGRIGFFTAGLAAGDDISPGTSTTGGTRNTSPSGGGGGGDGPKGPPSIINKPPVEVPPPKPKESRKKKPTFIESFNEKKRKKNQEYLQNLRNKKFEGIASAYGLSSKQMEELLDAYNEDEDEFDLSTFRSIVDAGAPPSIISSDPNFLKAQELALSKGMAKGNKLSTGALFSTEDPTTRIDLPGVLGKFQGDENFSNVLSGLNRLQTLDEILDTPGGVKQSDIDNYFNLTMGKGGIDPVTDKPVDALFTPRDDDGPSQETDPCKGPNPPAYCFANQDPTTPTTPTRNLGGLAPRFSGSIFDFTGLADGGRVPAMGGGIMNTDVIGGAADGNIDEMGRQMYFVGKLVKKATRAVKKVAKSPIGKAALFAGLAGAAGFGPFQGLKGKLFGTAMKSGFAGPGVPGLFTKLGLTKTAGSFMPTLKGGIALATLAPFIFQGDEEEENFDPYRGPSIDIANIRANPYNFLAPRFQGSTYAADGGLMRMGYQEGGDAEPVAKKTMPLIDMDGKEKDYRETGGFVDMGRMERADDVPARLSKNEFVFTADAVRNAGEGNIDKGAEVMYNMMKNLEAGGEVSEESQGLEGAREMFKTSQRLEEVL